MKNKTIVIGDIHGHYKPLTELMNKLQDRKDIDFERDVFVFLGDYVDGGNDVKGVLDELIVLQELYPHWKFLIGNHETMLLDALSVKKPIYGDYYHWWNQGGKETLNSFKPAQSMGLSDYEKAIMQPKDLVTKEYMDFLRNLDLFYENDDYFCVHGGLYPNRSIEAHKKVVGTFHIDALREGDMAYDMLWMRDPFLGSKYDWGKKIIFGHTMFPWGPYWTPDDDGKPSKYGYPMVQKNKIGIDTISLFFNPTRFKGRLSALILPDEEFVYSEWM